MYEALQSRHGLQKIRDPVSRTIYASDSVDECRRFTLSPPAKHAAPGSPQSQTRAGGETGGGRGWAPTVCLWTSCSPPHVPPATSARLGALAQVSTGRCGPPPTCKACVMELPAAGENRAGSCRRGPGRLPKHQHDLFLKADGFKETCPSFNVAGLLLIWALKPCDRSTRSRGLCGRGAANSRRKVEICTGTVGPGLSGGADGDAGSRALPLSHPE